jgi:FixJ family two-component response regulator
VTVAHRMVAVIEDDASVRGALFRLFKTAGLEATLFGSAEEYLACPERADAGCLVVDVRLPGIGGLDLLEQVRREHARASVVITAHPDECVRNRALAAGAIGFFAKPFDNRRLLDAVSRALAITDGGTSARP